jgi:hypothetical protein
MNTRPDAAAKCIACQRGACPYLRLPTIHTEAAIDSLFQPLSGYTSYSFVEGFHSYKTTLPVYSSEGSHAYWVRAVLGLQVDLQCHLQVEEDPLEPLEGHVTVVLSYFIGDHTSRVDTV